MGRRVFDSIGVPRLADMDLRDAIDFVIDAALSEDEDRFKRCG